MAFPEACQQTCSATAGTGHTGDYYICHVLRFGSDIWRIKNQVEVGRGESCIYYHRTIIGC